MGLIDVLRRRFFHRYTRIHSPPALYYIVYAATGCRNIYIPDRHLDYVPDELFVQLYTGYENNQSPLWDCDDRARSLWCHIRNEALTKYRKNLAFGMLWTERHALCLYVTPETEVRFIEPMNGRPTIVHSRVRFIIF